MTRIVAGSAGGRRIDVPPRGTRPTSDRVREAVFSALEAAVDLDGARVLDLYGGSGALGFEALSRGAAHATFVEADRRAAQIIRRNAAALGFRQVVVEQAKAETALATPPGEPYDVVLADPPYDLDPARLAQVLAALATGGWTAPGGLVVLEQSTRSGDPAWPAPLVADRTRRYGDTAVHWAFLEDERAFPADEQSFPEDERAFPADRGSQ
ncbi:MULTISPECIES: 16S rRNA (guanine(966)-N(2))-methyltransferase RsmD [unclassified Saccharopolyspora]|uniref:16S rRNA (guanine(966)-N(2))-methyltransferase RsmD n=1 Tax=unclassified Saccharopolyspora TaxID=2646250 RepID=UPI001CD2E983|nr:MULTISPECIES: 16S rRNA (guanine(966)-N(2))-methyltransferase RsmD [unclassified Saccharopolyspora]MCA1187780.1 16S rRNA (guanine(966)-N(2))-methyltransferase RsmD [Saccharopolyspora sp. 6T]MCA1227645.1 16S rRNA (guanine(966)-N(2))-methyltransferase RsmD [Saccharopolyspora sp. 6M]MCA1279846.1 16S rRNA (guanine(966)-N(2))-methyltransferase RsmD [Saccharopolyspora sp. 7B]